MTKTSFSLDVQAQGDVLRCSEPAQVVVPLSGHSTKTVKKKAEVAPGTLVADHPGRNTGDAHSPIAGVVADIGEKGVTIKAQEVEVSAEPVKTDGLAGDELRAALKALGVDTLPFLKASTLVVNGLNPEPGVAIASWLMANRNAEVAKGFAAVKNLTGASDCKLVSPQGSSASLEGCSVVQVAPVYPNSIHALAVKAATGKELPEGVLCVDVHTLYQVGQALKTGMPVSDVLLSVEGKIVQAKVGQPVKDVLEAAGVSVQDHDDVVFGGPMRGESVQNLEAPVSKGAFAVTVIRAGEFPPVTDEPCINCGSCVAACPARIQPNMIGRYAEFKNYGKTRDYGVDYCFECGLCGFYCTARRPLLQYIRLAKQELAAEAAQLASCALNEE